MEICKEDQMLKCIQKKRLALTWLLGTVYLAFICLELGQVQEITDFSYRLHELLFLPVNVAIFIVPVEVVIYLYYFFKCIGKTKEQSSMSRKAIILLVWLSIVLMGYTLNYQSYDRQVSGIFIINERLEENNKFYLVLNDGRKIQCTRNEYYLVIKGQEYAVDFNWNDYSQNGSLEVIRTKKYALENRD